MKKKKTRYIFVTGGVVSSLGKGIVASSLGVLLKSKGYKVSIQKFDPYLNIDPGTMSPYQHGEVFVTDDGCETDLDLGHYERFIDQNLSRSNNVTSGMVFWNVLNKERKGDYLGNTVQIIPHITDEIKDRIKKTLKSEFFDFVITEIGGTVGDIESQPFLEAIRQFQYRYKQDCVHIHVTLVPYINAAGEYKTKPTQHSVKELREIGIHPDLVVCRCQELLTKDIKRKIALFCDVQPEAVITSVDAKSIYDLPLHLADENMDKVVLSRLGMRNRKNNLTTWKRFTKTIHNETLKSVKIGLVGKYTDLSDSYLSVTEALNHAAAVNKVKIEIEYINAEEITSSNTSKKLKGLNGLLIPGGFGDRGVDGKVLASKYAREKKIPYFGLCLGMHVASLDIARHVLNLEDAHSIEFKEDCKNPIISFLPGQQNNLKKGGTMRLGAYTCKTEKGSLLNSLYKSKLISERHRHRYEFNNEYINMFEENGVIFSGKSEDDKLVEVIELKDHPWYLACQFHPEFKSRPHKGHPLFNGFVGAALTSSLDKSSRKN